MRAILIQMQDALFAINILDLKEVIRHDPKKIQNDGILSIRGQFAKVLDAGTLFFGITSTGDRNRWILLEKRNQRIAIMASNVSRVVELRDEMITPLDPSWKGLTPRHCQGVTKLNSESSPIFVVDVQSLFESSTSEESQTLEPDTSVEIMRPSRLVCFRVGSCEYGFPIENTVEIIRGRESHFLPQTEKRIEGVINLRGNVIPVMDLRRLTQGNIPELARDPKGTKIVVTQKAGQLAGFIVDSVTEVLRYDESKLEPIPPAFEALGSHWIKSLLKVEQSERLVFIVNPDWFYQNAG